MQNVYEVFFIFLFFFTKALDMRWKDLSLFFDENASLSLYEPSKFFRFDDFEHFFQKFRIFQSK